MSLKTMLAGVLDLQKFYSDTSTPQMKERGVLVRSSIPDVLKKFESSLGDAASTKTKDLIIQGRDHTGRRSHVPWVRVASKKYSPKATQGWYVVLLFRYDGAGVYLALECGATEFAGGSYITRSKKYLQEQIQWARAFLKEDYDSEPRLAEQIYLASKGGLAKSYERSTVFAFYYPRNDLPDDQQFLSDLLSLMPHLSKLYAAVNYGLVPQAESPDVRDAVAQIEAISRPRGRSGQGFGLSGAERKAVEMRAMKMATEHLEGMGYECQDVSKKQPFDIRAVRKTDGAELKVEVKGTTGGLKSILLTTNEVELHKLHHPANALIVVHGISLQKGDRPIAVSGEVHPVIPWKLEEGRLKALSFSYTLSD